MIVPAEDLAKLDSDEREKTQLEGDTVREKQIVREVVDKNRNARLENLGEL